jgi:hypothetical protein
VLCVFASRFTHIEHFTRPASRHSVLDHPPTSSSHTHSLIAHPSLSPIALVQPSDFASIPRTLRPLLSNPLFPPRRITKRQYQLIQGICMPGRILAVSPITEYTSAPQANRAIGPCIPLALIVPHDQPATHVTSLTNWPIELP